MKKTIVLILAVLISLLFAGCAKQDEPKRLITKTEIAYMDGWKIDKETQDFNLKNGYKYDLFVYGNDNDVMSNILFDASNGPADYKEGYLYVKDMEADKLYQLSNEPVETCNTKVKNKNLFVYNHEIFVLSEDFTDYTSIYKGNGNINFNVLDLADNNGFMYFVDGDEMVKLNLSDNTFKVLTDGCYGNSFAVKNDKAVYCNIYLENEKGTVEYIINIEEGYARAVINVEEFKMFVSDENFYGQETEYTYIKSEPMLTPEK